MDPPRRPNAKKKNGSNHKPTTTTTTTTHVQENASTPSAILLDALADVLREACARGIDLVTSFQHFDRRQQGLVGADEFMAAIVELRIGSAGSVWDERDAEDCIESINRGRSRAYFSQHDFVQYFARVLPKGRSHSAESESRNENKRIQQQQNALKKQAKALKIAKLPKQQRLYTNQQQQTRNNDHSPMRDFLDEYQGHSSVYNSLNDSSVMTQFAASTASASSRKKRPLVSLASWAHDRSKRALQELASMQQRQKRFHPSNPLGLYQCDEDPTDQEDPHTGDDQGGERGTSKANGAEISKLMLPASSSTERDASSLEFPTDPRWQRFQVDDETSLAYAILSHDTVTPSTSSSSHDNDFTTKRELATTKHLQEEESHPVFTAFRFTVFLDAFQRFETLEEFFRPFLVHFPRGKILLCGFPTKTPRKTIWNSEMFAQVYGELLVYLMDTTREWLVQPKLGIGAVPQYLCGFGTGGNAALRFLAMEIPLRMQTQPQLRLFLRSQRGLILINALTTTSDSVRRSLEQLRRVASSENRVELNESLIASLFSEFYLTQVAQSRQTAMESFFQTRKQFVQRSSLELLRVLLHGSIKSKDLSHALGNLSTAEWPFSLVVVHGTQNALFPASQVELLTNAFPKDNMSPNMASCLASESPIRSSSSVAVPQIHVSWLKSGHEVLQERSTFMYDLFRQLVLADVSPTPLISPLATVDRIGGQDLSRPATNAAVMKSDTDLGGPKDLLEEDRHPTTHDCPASECDGIPVEDVNAHVKELLDQNGIKWIQQELYDRGLDGSGTRASILSRFQQALEEEDAKTREKRRLETIQSAKYEHLELQRRERQREELERQLRDREAQLRIKRKEHEAQKAFFVQMEEQKDIQARMALEHELMALEDVFSRKYEEHLYAEEERRDRNTEMAKQVGEIAAERLEKEREEYQVQLQQERLRAQQVKREKLKLFQKEFEQTELVSSPVEAYMLDVAPTYENFDQLAQGGRELAKDLMHFYDLKTSQKEESVEKRLELDEFKKLVATKELALRNLDRVIAKAKSTGMIAKAGLGTVRIVPITTQEFQTLNRDLDEKRDEMARLQQELALKTQELSWKDHLLQRLSALIKRNEGFRGELLSTLSLCNEKGNEMVLNMREEGEKLFEQREANTKAGKRHMIRLHAVRDERRKAAESSTEYFDTRLRIEGTTQRVLRHVLIRELDAEIADLEKKMRLVESQEGNLKAQLKANAAKLNEFGARTFELEQSLAGLEQAIATKDRQATNEGGSSNALSIENDLTVNTDLAEQVRCKLHANRTEEEKKWIALDFQINFAHYYKCIDADEVEIIQKHPDYQQCPLKKEQIQRLLTLPSRNCLALAFFKAKEEVESHYLLRKYTFGDGEDHFACHDRRFVLAEEQNASMSVVTSKLGELPSAVDEASAKGKAAGCSIPKGSYALLDENASPASLLRASQCQIHPHKSTTHTFKLPSVGAGVLSLMVSIVFQGHFKSVGYQNGRLAGMLYILPPAHPQSSSSDGNAKQAFRAPLPIGKCFHQQDIELCTPHSMGKLVIRHEPHAKPLNAAATYQVVLGAPVFTSYSIEITAKTALFASEVLKRKRSDALKKQELLPLKKDEIQSVFVTIQLSERKKRLAKKMTNEAKDAARAAELEMIRRSKELEEDNAASLLSYEERVQLHATIHSSETNFTQNCFLYAKREEEARDIEQGLKELTKIHADLLDDCDAMERDLVEYRAHLPELAASLVETRDVKDRDAAGAKVARELNVEYVSSGAKSSKVMWAELSAMKAKLPSMMTPAERLRRKYKKGQDLLEKKEREWILLDRILHPRTYDWEERLVAGGDSRMRLHGAFPKLTKDEEQLAVLSQMEVDRIMKAPWNLLERKEIQIRKIVTKFRDDNGGNATRKTKKSEVPTSMVALLRSQKTTELTIEEREWRLYDQLLNPSYYPINMKKLADDLRNAIASAGGVRGAQANLQLEVKIPPNLTREDLVAALNTPEEELFKLSSELLRARTLLLKYDPQLSTNLVEAARMQLGQTTKVEAVEMDVDARCRLVYQELQRAIANTSNEFMDSYVLHSTLQRFPTKVLRLELEKELDRLLISQVAEKEEFELRTFLLGGDAAHKALGLAAKHKSPTAANESDSVSDSDSDEEARIARELKAQRSAKLDAKSGKNAKIRGKALKQKSMQKQRREIKDVRATHLRRDSPCTDWP